LLIERSNLQIIAFAGIFCCAVIASLRSNPETVVSSLQACESIFFIFFFFQQKNTTFAVVKNQ